MVAKIWKDHTFPRGKRKGQREVFVVQPRAENGMYSVKKLGHRTNRILDDYDDIPSLDEVLRLLQQGRAVRMLGSKSNEWNTLNNKGIQYA